MRGGSVLHLRPAGVPHLVLQDRDGRGRAARGPIDIRGLSGILFAIRRVVPMVKRLRWIGLTVFVGFMLAAAEKPGWASCGTCQVCKQRTNITIPSDYCAVANSEDGSMCCSVLDTGAGKYCYESGSACYGIIVGGGGGGGSAGGGGATCSYQNGWCPAECMSCDSSGGGGRPAV